MKKETNKINQEELNSFNKTLNSYDYKVNSNEIKLQITSILKNAKNNYNEANLKFAFSSIDLTSLNLNDTDKTLIDMCQKVNKPNNQYSNLPNVAGLCAFPKFMRAIKQTLSQADVKIVSVAGMFPALNTPTEIKISEALAAINDGADEIDIVISMDKYLAQEYFMVSKDIENVKKSIKQNHLKVILESGAMPSLTDVRRAAILAMEAGADFIKTSTGKREPAATHEAVFVMAEAVKEFAAKTGKKVGIKAAGGISTAKQAIEYISIIKHVLGNDWLTPKLFRIGASRLANNLLEEITIIQGKQN